MILCERGSGHSLSERVFDNQFYGDENEKFNCLTLRCAYVVVVASVCALLDAY
jgi:hypothetical protein